LADRQLEKEKKRQEQGEVQDVIVKSGLWSVVRHPNYLGDALVHLSFPLLSIANSIFDPLMLLGPAANYISLRYIGERANEKAQERRYRAHYTMKYKQWEEYRNEKNGFWPAPKELIYNPWSWVILGIGALAAGGEWALQAYW